jgi:predicted enzyme related to lactoylglutathione lyase
MFQQDGQNFGGLMGHMQEGQPTAWSTYVSVADADETTDKGRPSFEGAPPTYTVWELAGKPVGGMMQMTDDIFGLDPQGASFTVMRLTPTD